MVSVLSDTADPKCTSMPDPGKDGSGGQQDSEEKGF